MAQNTSTAVMQRRKEAPDSLDYFPTPPWATRALVELVLKPMTSYSSLDSCWEPACGEGHMAETLREYFSRLFASDIHDYGRGYAVGDFTADLLRSESPFCADWIITNPPYNEAQSFLHRAIGEAKVGVAMLLRTNWLEGGERWKSIFSVRPPSFVAIFSGRVAMVKGRWDPDASSATAYAWFIWEKRAASKRTEIVWIRPSAEAELTRASDRQMFGDEQVTSAPLFDALEGANS